MTDAVSTAGRCDALADAALAQQCRQTFEACDAFADGEVQTFCAAQAESCAVQAARGADTYELASFEGKAVSAGSASTCFRLARRAAAIAHPSTGAPQEAPKKTSGTADPEDAEDACRETGDAGTPGNARCRELVDQCLDGDRTLVTRGVAIGAANLKACISLAARIAVAEFGAPPKQASSPATASSPESWSSDGATTFSRKLAETKLARGFAVGSGTVELDLHIPFGGNAYHIPLAITYTAAEAGDGLVRLTYAIADDRGAALSGEQTIELAAADGIFADTLAFGITLSEAGNFAKVRSVKIVKLP